MTTVYWLICQLNAAVVCPHLSLLVIRKLMLDLIRGSKIKSCALDQLPASLMRKCYTTTLVPILKRIINQSLTPGKMPDELKNAMLLPLLQKANADSANYRTVSKLKFVSKLIEKALLNQMNDYLTDNDLHLTLQSAYSFRFFLLAHSHQ